MSKLKKGILAAFDHVTECMIGLDLALHQVAEYRFLWRAAS